MIVIQFLLAASPKQWIYPPANNYVLVNLYLAIISRCSELELAYRNKSLENTLYLALYLGSFGCLVSAVGGQLCTPELPMEKASLGKLDIAPQIVVSG